MTHPKKKDQKALQVQSKVVPRHGPSSALDAREAGATAHQRREAASELVGQLPGMGTKKTPGKMVV